MPMTAIEWSNPMFDDANSIIVHKFGGTSLSQVENFQSVKDLIDSKNQVIVASAIAGATDCLQHLLESAKQKLDYQAQLVALEKRHHKLSKNLLTEQQHQVISDDIKLNISSIQNILNSVSLVGSYSKEIENKILAYGELWSNRILASYLNQEAKTILINAADILYIRHRQEVIDVDWERSHKALTDFLKEKSFDNIVITGFIAADFHGKLVNLGRNGSDSSAAIFAKLFNADELIIWTDVDGVFSADPKRVNSAFAIEALSYKEALELAYFGASILHPYAIMPAIDKQIPIIIKNSLNPSARGTKISADKVENSQTIRGLTSIENIALINIEGTGMMGVSGIAARVFQSMNQANISVILISQASSEHSICFAINDSQAKRAHDVIKDEFHFEIEKSWIERIVVDDECGIIAAVGDGMIGVPGIAGKLCHVLANANINIRAIAQGSSERNISIVVQKNDITRALRVVHSGFYLSHKTISIGIIGPGLVGSTLIEQIKHASPQLRDKQSVQLSIRGIMNSKRMLLTSKRIDLDGWREALDDSEQLADLEAFAEHIVSDDIPHAVIIDCTANQMIAEQYLYFMNKGIHIITPNKRANSGSLDYYQNLKKANANKHSHYFYEATVCAGLPVINTLQDLIKTGDEIHSIEGIVSGTLAYIFNAYAKGIAFSEIILEAQQAGFTEPDPRDDLSGLDVARKFVCLARELGHQATLDDVKVHNLIPGALSKVSVSEFMERLPDYDEQINKQFSAFIKPGEKICYVGKIDRNGKIEVCMKAYQNGHPFYALNGADNMLIIKSKRYCQQPLVIQGPGAGAEVTAAGVFADLLRLVSYLSD